MTMEIVTHKENCLCEKATTNETSFLQFLKTGVSSVWQQLLRNRALRKQRKQNRLALETLHNLDERTLKDIGLNRSDVVWASGLPMNINAAEALNEIRARNVATTRRRVMHNKIKHRR